MTDTAFDLGTTLARRSAAIALAITLLAALATGGAGAETALDPSGHGVSADPGP